MKVTFENENKAKALEIFRAIASKDRTKSWEAQEALAALVGPIVDQVIEQAATHKSIYQTIRYDLSQGAPSIPIDTYFGNTEGALKVWSQSMPGGTATNLVSGGDEYRFTTHTINSAVAFNKKYVEQARLDVLAKGMERLAQEVLVIQEWQAWYVLLSALGGATTDGATHLIAGTGSGTFVLNDLNRLMTKQKRLRKSWVGGTPGAAPGRGMTDLFVSPEVMEDIRSMAYNPVNSNTPGTGTSSIALPDAERMEIWKGGGQSSLFNVTIHELLEFGVGQVYNTTFDQVYSGSPAFNAATQELVLGADLSLDAAVMVEGTDRNSDNVFRTQADDQFIGRSGKVGWYGEAEVGFVVPDVKTLTGCIV